MHLWQLPLGTMMLPQSEQVGASLRAMKLNVACPLLLPFPLAFWLAFWLG